jgi:hypothetical protein
MSQFRLMTWNVENLFDVGDDDGPKTQAQFAAKIESLRAVIDAQRPHVLTLQEVGSESALAKLQAALEHKLPHRAVAEPMSAGSGWRSSADGCYTTRPRSGRSLLGCCRCRSVMIPRGRMGRG